MLPVFSELLTDYAGGFWMSMYASPGALLSEWIPVGRNFQPIDQLAIPAGARLEAIRAEFVLTSITDSVDRVEFRLHALRRNPTNERSAGDAAMRAK
jgi:hypothetical protein